MKYLENNVDEKNDSTNIQLNPIPTNQNEENYNILQKQEQNQNEESYNILQQQTKPNEESYNVLQKQEQNQNYAKKKQNIKI